jgi:hypothetical protein
VKGEPSDISTIAEYEWYEWVKLCDTFASFPVYKVQLGRDVGTAIDIGSAVARNIMKASSEVMYQTSVRSLAPEQTASPVERQAHLNFYIQIEEKIGPPRTEDYFKDDPDFADFESP